MCYTYQHICSCQKANKILGALTQKAVTKNAIMKTCGHHFPPTNCCIFKHLSCLILMMFSLSFCDWRMLSRNAVSGQVERKGWLGMKYMYSKWCLIGNSSLPSPSQRFTLFKCLHMRVDETGKWFYTSKNAGRGCPIVSYIASCFHLSGNSRGQSQHRE